VDRIPAKTLEDLGWPQLVEHWARRAATARGAASIRGGGFIPEIEAARNRIAEVSEARDLASRDAALPLGGIEDVAAAIGRVRKAAALDAAELIAVAGTAKSLARLRAHLREHGEVAPRLAAIGAVLVDLGHVYHPILDAFDPEGRLVDHASEALGGLRRAVAAIKQQLEKRMQGMMVDEKFSPYLQDTFYTQREDRYVLPVRHDGKGFVEGIVHGTSGSGQTLWIEPQEIVELNNRLKIAEYEVADEERRILAKFSNWVGEEADAIDAGVAAAETIDVIAAAARMAEDIVGAAPIVDDAPRIALLHARHPLMLLAERRCVANDVRVEAGQTLLVSGPNAGGKTVALKTVGLCALMTRAGLHLPAESGSAIGWFTDLRTDIGDAQSLEANLSTFTGHIVALRTFLAECGPGTLLLVDEIAVGTDPEQGAALAQAVLEALAARGVTGIVTTHYERLKALGAADERFANASVGFDLERMLPTFKLHLGTPGSSGALTVARNMGLPGEVVGRAQELMGGVGVSVEDLLAKVAEQRRRLEEERAMQLAEVEALESERMALKADRERQRHAATKQTEVAYGEAMTAIRQARREVDEVRADLRRKQAAEKLSAEDLQRAKRKIAGASATVQPHQPQTDLPPGKQAHAKDLTPGAKVIVKAASGLGGRGEVVSAPKDGQVEVRLGLMKMHVPVADVLLDLHKQAAPKSEKKAPRVTVKAAPEPGHDEAAPAHDKAGARTPDRTVDVRGQRVDEGVSAVDQFLDESLALSRDIIFVVHGHGTGALRQAIRAHLAKHPAVSRARPGEPNEGGDGVTVVFLKD
jgi:DNA mismatch repair protein MutS2